MSMEVRDKFCIMKLIWIFNTYKAAQFHCLSSDMRYLNPKALSFMVPVQCYCRHSHIICSFTTSDSISNQISLFEFPSNFQKLSDCLAHRMRNLVGLTKLCLYQHCPLALGVFLWLVAVSRSWKRMEILQVSMQGVLH